MTLVDLIGLALRMLRTRIMRTALTVLGVGVGIGAILFLVSLGYGLQRILLTDITSSDALLSLDVASANADVLPLNDEQLKKFAALAHVVEVSPLLSLPGRLAISSVAGDVTVNAVDPAFFRLGAVVPTAGRLFNNPPKREVVVSSATAKLFGFDEAAKALTREVKLTLFLPVPDQEGLVKEEALAESYTVVGVVDDDLVPFVFFPRAQLDTTSAPVIYAQVKVKVENSEFLEPIREAILELGFVVSALSDTIDQANKIFGVIQVVLGLFGVVALAVSAIGMFNTMTIALLERTQEIGIFKALGASRRDISRLFLTESSLIGFLGGLGGIALGLVGSQLFNLLLNFLAGALGGKAINLFFTPLWFILTIAAFSLVVGFLTGVFPARRAARLNPLMALRYK